MRIGNRLYAQMYFENVVCGLYGDSIMPEQRKTKVCHDVYATTSSRSNTWDLYHVQ